MPLAPCTNCLRFHYGRCREAPKHCYDCGELDHIERYCPYRQLEKANRWELLLGSHRWCDVYGIADDPDLRQRIWKTLKTSPGCVIFMDGKCIYRGVELHLRSSIKRRHTPLEERITRARSRSPIRERRRNRSRSPFRQYERDDVPGTYRFGACQPTIRTPSSIQRSKRRSLSPIHRTRRTPLPPRWPRLNNVPPMPTPPPAPRAARGSNAIPLGVPKARLSVNNRIEAAPGDKVEFKIPASSSKPNPCFNSEGFRAPLGAMSGNVPRNEHGTAALNVPKTAAVPEGFSLVGQAPRSQDQEPHSVLGLTKGASEA